MTLLGVKKMQKRRLLRRRESSELSGLSVNLNMYLCSLVIARRHFEPQNLICDPQLYQQHFINVPTMLPSKTLPVKQDVGFPVYALQWQDDSTVVASGGGGIGKSGILNKIVCPSLRIAVIVSDYCQSCRSGGK